MKKPYIKNWGIVTRKIVKFFKNIKSKIKGASFNHNVDFYNRKLKIAIEVEKTKTTTLLLDVIKFVVGNKRNIIDYGVLIIPDKYRNPKYQDGLGDIPYNRLCNELALINQILWIKDILIIEYDTSQFFE